MTVEEHAQEFERRAELAIEADRPDAAAALWAAARDMRQRRIIWHMSTCPHHPNAVDDPCEFCTSNALAAHSVSYTDSEGEERCSTCDKWLEPGYYTIEDHQRAVAQRDVIG